MREAELKNQDPWTEAEYLALGETDNRIELIDGGLLVSPAPRIAHQRIGRRLMTALVPAAEAAKLTVDYDITVRLGRDRIVEPDLATHQTVTLRLLRLDGNAYVEHAVAEHGGTLSSALPFPLEIGTEALLDF
jgi:Uma2 family endonuclease